MTTDYIAFPQISPEIFSLGPITLRWYGVMYLLGFIFAYWLAMRRAKQPNSGWTPTQVENLLFNGFFGLVIGGRVGDVFFYHYQDFLANPVYLFKIWQGGMSFHGGLIGAILAMWLTSRKQKRSFWATADFVAPLIPFALGVGRIGNFINDELWGRVTDVPWAVLFPNGGYLPRHPSQLYEAFLEGLVLFIILNLYIRKPRPVGSVAGLFLIGYGTFRFLVEYVREPDVSLFMDTITRGQLLSLPMIIFGLLCMIIAYKKSPKQAG